MAMDQWVSGFPDLMTFVGLVFVGLQMRQSNKQRRVESVQRLIDDNRELLSLGFSHPALFDILNDTGEPDREWEKRYLQLWLNHLWMVHTMLKHGGFDADFREGLETDMADTLAGDNMQRHWLRMGKFYSASFQERVNAAIAKLSGL